MKYGFSKSKSYTSSTQSAIHNRSENRPHNPKSRRQLAEGITCKIETGKALAVAGLHLANGGDGLALCSGDRLLEALVACVGVTLNAVATALEIPLRGVKVWAEGDLDFRGTLGVDKEAPIGFKNIRLQFGLDTDATPDQLASLLKLTERYCVVYQTLRGNAELSAGYELKK